MVVKCEIFIVDLVKSIFDQSIELYISFTIIFYFSIKTAIVIMFPFIFYVELDFFLTLGTFIIGTIRGVETAIVIGAICNMIALVKIWSRPKISSEVKQVSVLWQTLLGFRTFRALIADILLLDLCISFTEIFLGGQ